MTLKRGLLKPEPVESMVNVRQMLHHAKKAYPGDIAYRQIENKIYESAITFRGLSDNVDALGTALLAEGFNGLHIGLIGETSIEWITAWLSIINGVGVVVPLDRELTVDTLAAQIHFADIDAIVCTSGSLKKLLQVLPRCPEVKKFILMRPNEKTRAMEIPCEQVYDFETLLSDGRRLLKKGDESYTGAEIDCERLCELIFTSGTTGANKGVMLSHRNLLGVARGARRLVTYKKVSFSVLPINHTYELSCHVLSCIYEGTTVCINDDLKHVMQNLQHFAPQMSCMVPMMLELMVRQIKSEIKKRGLEKYLIFGFRVSDVVRAAGVDMRSVFFKPIRSRFGGNLELIICGGAPLAQEIVDYLDTIGITVLNGYGITECAPLVAVNGLYAKRKGSVGHVLPSCEVRIVDKDENGNGEIQVKGDNVMLGYYKSPEDTASVFTDDGWFRTGDIGHLERGKYLYINGRLKNLIILSNGKNIYPEEIEDGIKLTIPYVKEVVVLADETETGMMALCYLDPEFRENNGLEERERAMEYLLKDIRKFNQKVPSFKRIMDVEIVDEEFEKTSTRKIKRFRVMERRTKNV